MPTRFMTSAQTAMVEEFGGVSLVDVVDYVPETTLSVVACFGVIVGVRMSDV